MTTENRVGHEQLLDELIAEYLQLEDSGRAPDRAQFIASHPEFAVGLQRFFANQERFGRCCNLQPSCPTTADFDPQATAAYVPAAVETQPSGHSPPTVEIRPYYPFVVPPIAGRAPVEPGTILAGLYRIFAIAAGAMGQVYLAEDLSASTSGGQLKVALKSVVDREKWKEDHPRKDEAEYDHLVVRFREEAWNWVRLGKHPNIVHAWTVIEIGAKP